MDNHDINENSISVVLVFADASYLENLDKRWYSISSKLV